MSYDRQPSSSSGGETLTWEKDDKRMEIVPGADLTFG